MKRFGLFAACGLAILLFASLAGAAITGQVDQIGFQNIYRPDCWTPMLVSIHPDGAVGTYELQVIQEDLDRDRVVYQRPVTLAGGTAEQRFWTCFIPQPTNGGLPDANSGLSAQQSRLHVYLADAGGKLIVQLPLTQTITNIDPTYSRSSVQRATKLILTVADAATGDGAPRFSYDQVFGVKENVVTLAATPADLPDDCLGYESLDAIVLMNVDPAALKSTNKFDALLQWVKEGGNLLICQNPQWQKMLAWGDLVPVTYPAFGAGGGLMQGSADRNDPGPLLRWGAAPPPSTKSSEVFPVAVAQPRAKALVVDQISWTSTGGSAIHTPYLVRGIYGLGTVTWIAVDIGQPTFARANLDWPRVWRHIFQWNDDPRIPPSGTTAADQQSANLIHSVYDLAHGVDLGTALLGPMEHAGRSASLLLVVAIFFAIYWFLAGPGTYLFLMARQQIRQSWFWFAAVALGATLFTYLVVKIALHGPPDAHAVSIVRGAIDQPAVIRSRIGLYIPHDNPAEPIALADTSGDSYLTPYPIHPQQMQANAYAGYMQYTVGVRDAMDEQPPLIRVPYRSTLKKLQAKWIGQQPGIEGTAHLLPPGQGLVRGSLTNGLGRELFDVYLVFNYPAGSGDEGDWALYVPTWQPGGTIDLQSEFASANTLQMETEPRSVPAPGARIKARIDVADGSLPMGQGWEQWWYQGLIVGDAEQAFPPNADPYNAFVMLSLFDRLPTPRNEKEGHPIRFELQRHGARLVNASNIVAAGGLLVLARSEGALPFPLEVAGDRVAGSGTVYYQMVVPMDHTSLSTAQLPTTATTTQTPSGPTTSP